MTLGGRSRNRGVGRAGELATAAFARDTARAGMGSVLAVTGPSGSGKTWLCESIAESATDEGFRVGWGTGWPGGGVPLLWPWQQAVEPLGERSAALQLFATPSGAPLDLDGPEWFARCVAVVDHLRALSADRPTLVILDDAHHADEPSRRLAYFVARHVRALPLLLVVAHQPSDDLAVLDRDATAVTLHGLDAGEAGALLVDRGVAALPPDDLGFVVAATGGLPGALHRLANRGTDPAGLVGALVDQQVAELPDDLARAAGWAAVADAAPRLGELAALLDASGAAVDPMSLVTELERRGLARRAGLDQLAFGHEQVRTALTARLAPAEVLEAHGQVARLLGDQPPSLDRLQRRADHALAAAGRSPDDARLAVEAAQDVAAALIAANEPERAAHLLVTADSAHEAAGFGPSPAALLAALGGALQRCGRLAAARDQFRRAATAAEKEHDAISLALAALGLGGVWLAEERSPIARERLRDLTERARDALPTEEVALRLRLDVRMSAEVAYESGDYGGIEAQVAAARALGDPVVLAEALSLYHHSMLGPKRRDKRAAIAEEMVSVAARADDHAAQLMALVWLTTDQFLTGSPQAERTHHELHERAEALSGRHAAYIASVMDVMLLQREGRLAEAEAAADHAFALGMEVGDADALGYYGGQLVTLRWIQGRAAEVLDLAAETESSPTITPLNLAFTATLASLAATCGELDRARSALSRLAGGLQDIHQSSAWLVTLFSVVEAAYLLDDAEIAREAAEQMAPYADLPVIGSLGVSCLGSARRSLGLAAVTVGDLDVGIELLEAAVADNERLGNRPLAAMTAVDLARARARRGDPGRGDRPAALALLDQAIRDAEAMDLPLRAAEWSEHRAAVAGGPLGAVGVPDPGTAPPARPEPEHAFGTIERRGRSWALGAIGHEVVVPDLLGMTYLVQLLTNPRVEIAAATLVGEGNETAAALATQDAVDQPLLDPAALAAYRRRVTELEDDLAEAERYADDERAARARIELDAIVDELARATNRFGRARPFSSSHERARTAVQKAVRRTLDHIAHEDPALGTLLRASVRTGRTCCYDPTPDAPTRWTVLTPA